MLVTTFLAEHDARGDRACDDGRAFALQYRTMEEVWQNCQRSDWMLWILARTKPMPATMARRFACWCVRNTPLADGRTVWDLLTDERSRNALMVAERHADGEATDAEMAAARDAARAAAWAAGAAWAAAGAAWDAARDAAGAAGAAGAAARDAQSREIRRLIPSLSKWTAPKRKAVRRGK